MIYAIAGGPKVQKFYKLTTKLFPTGDQGLWEATEPRVQGAGEGEGRPVGHGLVVAACSPDTLAYS